VCEAHSESIAVFGDLQVGSLGTPFQHAASIVLHGNVTSDTLVVDDNYFLGNKVFAVFGNVTLVGPVPATTWTRLAATAQPGDSSIVLAGAVAWPVGATIVVTPTE
jgi:hypothetical protein